MIALVGKSRINRSLGTASFSEAIAKPIVSAIDPKKREEVLDEQDSLRVAAITDAEAYTKAKATGGAALRIAQIKAQASCRKLENAGYADVACLEVP